MLQKSRIPLAGTAALILLAVVLFVRMPSSDSPPVPTPVAPGGGEYLVCNGLSGAPGGHLVASINQDLSTFNLMFTASIADTTVDGQLSADLVHINRSTYELEPALAKSWSVAEDNRTYTMELRRGLRFSDGSPFRAEDVMFTLDALMDEKTLSNKADQLRVDGKFPAITLLDDWTVQVSWPRPVGTGLRAFDSIPILPKSRLEKAYREGDLASAWGPAAQPDEIVGLGAFRLKEYRRGDRVVLERNPYYWKQDAAGQVLPYLDTVTFLIIKDRNSEALRFAGGEIDILGNMNPENYLMVRNSGRAPEMVLQDLGPGLGMDFLWFNLNPGKNASGNPFVDPEKRAVFEKSSFRRAVSNALDRKALTRILSGFGTPQCGPISSGNTKWYDKALAAPPFDPEEARLLLAESGLRDTNGDGFFEFGARNRPLEINLITASGTAVREKTAEAIRQYLGQVGLRVNIQLLQGPQLIDKITRTFDYEAILFGVMPTDIDPDLQSDMWNSSGNSHFWFPHQSEPHSGWEAEIDTITARLVQTLDPGARTELFNRVQQIWVREMPAIPTMAANMLTGWSRSVGNVRPSLLPPSVLWNAAELTFSSR